MISWKSVFVISILNGWMFHTSSANCPASNVIDTWTNLEYFDITLTPLVSSGGMYLYEWELFKLFLVWRWHWVILQQTGNVSKVLRFFLYFPLGMGFIENSPLEHWWSNLLSTSWIWLTGCLPNNCLTGWNMKLLWVLDASFSEKFSLSQELQPHLQNHKWQSPL